VGDIALALTGDAAELEARAKARHDADEPAIDWFTVLFYIAIFVLIAYLMHSGIVGVPTTTGGRRGGSTSSSVGGGWSSGGGGGGGFSGGGGSFGGGGSSGSW